MKYVFLGVAIVSEVIGAGFLKASEGFTKLWPSVATVLAFICCFYCLSLALKSIPLSIAYAIWAGLGLLLTALVSFFIFKQKIDLPAIIGLALIIAGVVVINVFSKTTAH